MSYLKFIRNILLVERIQAYELEALGDSVEGLVVSFGAQGHLIGADLREGQVRELSGSRCTMLTTRFSLFRCMTVVLEL